MKRIVTHVDAGGRSCVRSCEELGHEDETTIWVFDPSTDVPRWLDTLGMEGFAEWGGPQTVGGGQWLYVTLRPGVIEEGVGVDDRGFHTTRTIDFAFVVDGEVALLLDAETIPLRRGDCVIQQATRHAWRVDAAAILLVFMLALPPRH